MFRALPCGLAAPTLAVPTGPLEGRVAARSPHAPLSPPTSPWLPTSDVSARCSGSFGISPAPQVWGLARCPRASWCVCGSALHGFGSAHVKGGLSLTFTQICMGRLPVLGRSPRSGGWFSGLSSPTPHRHRPRPCPAVPRAERVLSLGESHFPAGRESRHCGRGRDRDQEGWLHKESVVGAINSFLE